MLTTFHHSNTSLNSTDISFYQYLINNSQKNTPFHSLDFLNLINDSYTSVELKFISIYKRDSIIAMMPYFQSKRNPLRIKSSFQGCYGGYVYLEENKDDIIYYLKNKNIHKPFTSIISFQDNLLAKTKKWQREECTTWIMKTNETYLELYKKIHYKTRNQIQKAIKSKIIVTNIKTQEELKQAKTIYKSLISKHNIRKPYPDSLFNIAFEKSKTSKNILFKVAKLDDTVVSFSIFICSETEIFYWINASAPKFLNLNGTNAILNDTINFCANSKIDKLNFGGVPSSNKGLLHFKKRWNTYEYTYEKFTNTFFHNLKNLIKFKYI